MAVEFSMQNRCAMTYLAPLKSCDYFMRLHPGFHATRLMWSTIVEKADLVSAHSHSILQAFDGVTVNKLLLQREGMTRSTIPPC